MNKIEVLITAVILLFRSRELSRDNLYDHRDIVKSILSVTKNKKREISLDGDIRTPEQDLSNLLFRMIDSPESYDDKIGLLGELKIIFRSSPIYYDSASDQLNADMTEAGMKRSINSLRNKLYKYYQGMKALQLINRTAYNLNNEVISKSIIEDIKDILPELDMLTRNTTTKDPGLMDTLVLSSKDDLDTIVGKIKVDKQEGGVLKTGWKQLNTCLQSGFRKGETVIINALQHNYKSGFVQSIFMQIARYNKPVLKDPTKKPALMYISLEDEIKNVLQFMYRYLFYNENRRLPDDTEDDISNLTSEQIQDYVVKRLGQNGYELIMLRGDPALWTYQDILATVNKYEAEGYEFHLVIVDYLAKLPTTGCDNNGIAGYALRDMFNRLRNFAVRKGFCFITPHQVSTEAKTLVRNGVPDYLFVKEIAGKGYTEGSKQIDQVVDLELYIGKAKINKKWHLTIQRGKHRGVGIIDDNQMYFVLPFPYRAPILENLNDPDTGNDGFTTEEDELFNVS